VCGASSRRQETVVERFRRDGRWYAGTVTLGDVRFWPGSNPEPDVVIVYQRPAGTQVLPGRMRTSPSSRWSGTPRPNERRAAGL
jgi:hypothetical protein